MTRLRASLRLPLPALALALFVAGPLRAQQPTAPQASRVTVTFENASMLDVLTFFSRYSGRSIVAGAGVAGTVTARIEHQPWDQALDALLQANGFYARELPSGILVVDNPKTATTAPGPVATRVFRLNYSVAAELEPAVKSMLTARGTISSVPSMNALVVTDEPRVLEQVAVFLGKN